MGRDVRAELLAKFSEPIPVLDHGFVQLVDVMGDDEAIEEAARISHGKGTRPVSELRGLLRYLLRHRHTSPFEMVEIKVRVKLPIFVERQRIRHRMASTNEVSARYSELPDETYAPPLDQICHQDRKNRQGRAERFAEEDAKLVRSGIERVNRDAHSVYRTFARNDLARETARIVLPLSTYTTKIWKIDGHNLLHFLGLRLDAHAQWEIRQYAEALAGIVREWLPVTWEAFEDYRLRAATLSRMEIEVLREIVSVSPEELLERCRAKGMTGREWQEFARLLGLDG